MLMLLLLFRLNNVLYCGTLCNVITNFNCQYLKHCSSKFIPTIILSIILFYCNFFAMTVFYCLFLFD